jgi:DivIVA domain-containing protein
MPDRDPYGAPMGPPGGGAPMSGLPVEIQRIDQLRRTFQVRRFGSGYDPNQVDRLFEGLLNAMTGRGSVPISENELDSTQFSLVPGGYFEAEVDAALREVRDLLRRR